MPPASATSASISIHGEPKLRRPWLHLALVILICGGVANIKYHDVHGGNESSLPLLGGYQATRISGDILKLQGNNALLYLKYIPAFYSADHNPMVCWRGSGYLFLKVRPEMIDGEFVYTAELERQNEKLFTAWWYENGENKTIEQLGWRTDVMLGAKNYYLVNVTTADRSGLEKEIKKMHLNSELKNFFLNAR